MHKSMSLALVAWQDRHMAMTTDAISEATTSCICVAFTGGRSDRSGRIISNQRARAKAHHCFNLFANVCVKHLDMSSEIAMICTQIQCCNIKGHALATLITISLLSSLEPEKERGGRMSATVQRKAAVHGNTQQFCWNDVELDCCVEHTRTRYSHRLIFQTQKRLNNCPKTFVRPRIQSRLIP